MWKKTELAVLKKLDRPIEIQRWLNRIAYDPEYATSSPRPVMRDRKANCFEGALFAAAALRELGHRPLLVDIRSWNDDDHVIAVFRERGRWGAVAKSNFTVLRFREPVYRSVRELVMSYFDVYFNAIGQKTMRSYLAAARPRPVRPARLDDDRRRPGIYRGRSRRRPALSGVDAGHGPGAQPGRPRPRPGRAPGLKEIRAVQAEAIGLSGPGALRPFSE